MRKNLDKKYFHLTALIIAPVGYLFSVFYYFILDAPKSGLTVFIGLTLFLILILIFKDTKPKIQMNIGVFTYYMIFVFLTFFTGGVNSPNIWWLPLGAVMASNFLPKKETAILSALIILFILLIQIPVINSYAINEISFVNRTVFYNISLAFFAISIGLIVYVGKSYAEIIIKANKKSLKLLESQDRLASLGILAGNITHEINNPLQVLMGSSQFLNEELKKQGPSEETINKHAKTIDLKVSEIAEVVKGLRLLSRDGENDEVQVIELEKLIGEVCHIMNTDLSDATFEFSIENEMTDKSFQFTSNKILILRVLVNLITNSVYAIKEIEEKWVKLHVSEDFHHLKLRIIDSGHGIPDEIQEQIYEPLFTTKPDGEGTGIGLPLCRDIIESLGGKLRYELFNGNTSFLISLPKKSKLRRTS
ncbi:MAG: HAMP domain-containing histidine kinase [Oligoflexia bacterium]|nr:HAMP domain-containing histidine kinase [Oligoflexia bacterium]